MVDPPPIRTEANHRKLLETIKNRMMHETIASQIEHQRKEQAAYTSAAAIARTLEQKAPVAAMEEDEIEQKYSDNPAAAAGDDGLSTTSRLRPRTKRSRRAEAFLQRQQQLQLQLPRL